MWWAKWSPFNVVEMKNVGNSIMYHDLSFFPNFYQLSEAKLQFVY